MNWDPNFNRNVALLLLAVAFLIMLVVKAAEAHSVTNPANGLTQHYDPRCCNEKDCRPLKDHEVERVQGGYRVKLATPHLDAVFKDGEYKWSDDGRFHICALDVGTMMNPDEPSWVPRVGGKRCFFAPPPGV